MRHRSCLITAVAIAACLCLLPTQKVAAQASGTWTGAGDGVDLLPGPDGLWSNAGNWTGGVIASGANNTADFSTLDIADQTATTGFAANRVDFDAPRTLGHLIFGDTNTATPGVWEVIAADPLTNRLTLSDATKPTITVNALGVVPPAFDDVIIRPNLAGTNGFTKLGVGILSVSSTYDAATAANNLTGVINVNAGTLRILTGSTFDFETVVDAPVTSFNLANGTTLDARAFVRNITAGTGVTINGTSGVQFLNVGSGTVINATGGGVGVGGTAAAGANGGVIVSGTGTRTVVINNSAAGTTSIGPVGGGAGLTATINMSGGQTRIDRDWAQNGGLPVLNLNGTNIDGVTKSSVQLRPNGGAFGGWNNTTVNLDRVILNTNQNTGGNTITIGALNGTATAELIASGGGVGSSTFQIGGLNTNAVYAGSIGLNAASLTRSLNIFKQGTGTWELSGALTYTPQPELSNVNRRGGITRVETGTLKLTGAASLPAGNPLATHGVAAAGDLFSTVDIRLGATLDVSGTTTTYNSSALQQTIGRGTIVGNYNHDEGVLAPGDSVVGGNTASLIATAGTLTFANTLDFAGSGQVNFDISPSLVSGNDLLQVGGANLTGTPVIKVGFLGGASNGAYTLLNSNTPLVGSTAGWTVLWEGRGAAPTVTQTATQVKVNISAGAAGNLNWSGGVDGVWNAGVAGTSNWHNVATNAADKFFQLDNVAFRDTTNGVTPPTTTTITLNTVVSPSSVLVDSTIDYSVSGTGRITGGGSFTKRGSGTYTITTANDYSGTTTIEAGTLNIGTTGTLGSGPLVMSGGTLVKGGGAIANTLTLSGNNRIAHSSPGTLGLNAPISGSGTLTLGNANTTTVGAILGTDISASTAGFAGTIVIGEFDGVNMVNAPIAGRLTNSAAGNGNVAWQIFEGSNLSSKVDNVPTTHQLGSLSGVAATGLSGHGSGAGGANVTWQIGALNTSTVFNGLITDGNQASNPGNNTSILKVGSGTLTLGGFSTYTGRTEVAEGTLSISQAFLADTSDVFVRTGGVLDLNLGLGISDTIDSLFFNGVPQAPGTYGAAGSGATFTSSFFTGTGTLTVTTLGTALIAGDFDRNGSVNAADLTVWRGAVGNSAGGDADGDLDSDGNDFLIWQRNLGMGAPASAAASAVPEPSACLLVALLLPAVAGKVRRRVA